MKKFSGRAMIKYAIAFAVGLLLSYYVLVVNGYSEVTDEAVKLKLLADCFTVPGVIFIMSAAFCRLTSSGVLDGISFAIGGLFRRLIPGAQIREPEEYFDYVQRKQEKRFKGYGFLCIVGGVFLLLAIILIIKFYQVYQH